MSPTSDHGFLLVGDTHFSGTTQPLSAVLIKTDSTGNILWQRKLNYTGVSIYPTEVKETSDHGFMIVTSEGTLGKAQFLKTDSAGNALWNYGFKHSVLYQKLIFTDFTAMPDNRYITAGYLPFSPPENIAVVIDSAGNIVTAKHYPVINNEEVFSHCYTAQSGLAMMGYNGNFSAYGFYVNKTDTALNAACSTLPKALVEYSNTVTDSASSIVSLPVSLVVTDVTSTILVTNLLLQDSDYCAPVFTSAGGVSRGVVHCYPVPATESVLFNFEGTDYSTKKLRVYAVTGKLIKETSFTSNAFTFERNHLDAGIYFFEIQTQQEVLTGKLVFK